MKLGKRGCFGNRIPTGSSREHVSLASADAKIRELEQARASLMERSNAMAGTLRAR
jgi:hypothetical protein